ncbi:MAG: hypothetical protein JJT94_01960 [Bernardetiaceae bacterium]|nr:hypothetical protein [Bernardetiaceae bacterium]
MTQNMITIALGLFLFVLEGAQAQLKLIAPPSNYVRNPKFSDFSEHTIGLLRAGRAIPVGRFAATEPEPENDFAEAGWAIDLNYDIHVLPIQTANEKGAHIIGLVTNYNLTHLPFRTDILNPYFDTHYNHPDAIATVFSHRNSYWTLHNLSAGVQYLFLHKQRFMLSIEGLCGYSSMRSPAYSIYYGNYVPLGYAHLFKDKGNSAYPNGLLFTYRVKVKYLFSGTWGMNVSTSFLHARASRMSSLYDTRLTQRGTIIYQGRSEDTKINMAMLQFQVGIFINIGSTWERRAQQKIINENYPRFNDDEDNDFNWW